jgi:hypothetical protein
MAPVERKIFIGGGKEAEKRSSEGWFTNVNGSGGTTIGFLRRDSQAPTLVAGSDAQTCISFVTIFSLGMGAPTTVNLEDIRSHRETGAVDEDLLLVRGKDLAFTLNEFGELHNPNLTVLPKSVWHSILNPS